MIDLNLSKINTQKQPTPQFIWRRLSFTVPTDFIYHVRHGYNFFCKYIIVKAQTLDAANVYNKLTIKVIKSSSKLLTNNSNFFDFINFDSFSTPGSDSVVYSPAIAPVDNGALSVSSNADQQIKQVLTFNEIFSYSEPLHLKLRWDTLPTADKYCDIIVMGYEYITSKNKIQWGDK